MDARKLRTALIGLKGDAPTVLDALASSDLFHLVAVADSDTKLAERIAADQNCKPFDDYRQLVMSCNPANFSDDPPTIDQSLQQSQNPLDCLIVVSGLHSCGEHIRTAVKKGIHVLKLAPSARCFEEAAEFVRLTNSQKTTFAIANPLRCAESFSALDKYLTENYIEGVFTFSAALNIPDTQIPSWHTDPKLSGGGVLLQNCFPFIDQITKNFSIPSQVYCLTTSHLADKKQRNYKTEDSVTLTMKFSDDSFGHLTASRIFGPQKLELTINLTDKIITVTDSEFKITSLTGQKIVRKKFKDDSTSRMKKALEIFALTLISPEENKLQSSARENLANMAVIEAAYLSARTAMPEDPGKILHLARIEQENIWSIL